MNQEILKQLEAGVLAEKPGTSEHKIATDALTKYVQTMAEIEKQEAELRMKQNQLDDDITNHEDDMRMRTEELEYRKQKDADEMKYRKAKDDADAKAEECRSKKQRIMDGIKMGLSGLGLLINTVLAVEILKENFDGKPLVSSPGRALSNSILFREKK